MNRRGFIQSSVTWCAAMTFAPKAILPPVVSTLRSFEYVAYDVLNDMYATFVMESAKPRYYIRDKMDITNSRDGQSRELIVISVRALI